MMRRYPAYRDSGVEWLGEVPEGWEVVPVKRAFQVTLGKMLQNDQRNDEDFEAPYLRAANVQWGQVDVSDVKTMWFSPSEARFLALTDGDLLVSEGGDVGRSAVWRGEIPNCYIQNSVHRVRAIGANNTSFLYYWMATIKSKGFIDVLCNRSTIAHFTVEKFAEVPLPRPTLVEQTAIAAFLDRETAKIDALVDEQRRLIALLREKRQAVISHAVTKGLNPAAPMKPSGVDWLGDVPDGWEVATLRRCAERVQTGSTPRYADFLGTDCEGVSWYTPGDFREHLLLKPASKKIAQEIVDAGDASIFPSGGVLIVSIGATLGKVGLITLPSSANQQINAVIPKSFIDANFLAYSLASSTAQMKFLSNASTIGIMNQEKTKEIYIAAPPKAEQLRIIAHLQSVTLKFDNLVKEAESAITLLQERRAALISAAVTGKIDVRDLAAAETEAA